jgi:ankyrin repeat protein
VNAQNKQHCTPLHLALDGTLLSLDFHEGKTKTACRLLLESGANANIRNHEGNTPLHLAIELGRYDIIQLLLGRGADVHAKDNVGWTPYLLASIRGKREIMRLLSDHMGSNERVGQRTRF